MFYFSLKCYPEDIDKEALLSGTPMYNEICILSYLFLAGIHAHIRQVGRAALPVTVPTKPEPSWSTERTLLRRL